MYDDQPIASRRARPGIWRIVAIIVAGYVVLCLPLVDARRATCAVCRLDRAENRVLVIRWSRFEENELSQWYAAHVEPLHAHAWAERTHCQRIGIPGLTSGFACRIGAPIEGLSRSAQREAYQHSRDPLAIKTLFLRLGTREKDSYKLMHALSEWAAEHRPDTWDEWWTKRQMMEAAL